MSTQPWVGLLKLLVIIALVIAAYIWKERRRRRAIAAGSKTNPAGATPEQDGLACPVCRSVLPERNEWSDDIKCRECWTRFRYSSLLPVASREIDLETPPRGAGLERQADGLTVVVSMRSWLTIFTVPCALCVIGGVGVILLLGMKAPPGSAPVFGHLELLLISVFAAVVVALCLVPIVGQLKITRQGDRLTVFTGVGAIGWTSEHRWSSFQTVYEELQVSGGRMGNQSAVVLDGERRVSFGTLLTDKRRRFLLHAMRAMLAEKQEAAALATPPS